jgi:hypothetical protein
LAWESRKRGGKYYVRKHRVGNRIISEYIGCGAAAELIARLDEIERTASQRDNSDNLLLRKLQSQCFATARNETVRR